MPASQGLHGHGDEHYPLPPARFACLGHLPVEGGGKGVARCGGGLCNLANLERVDHCDVEGCGASSCPVRDEDVPRSGICSRKQILFLPGSSKTGCLCCSIEGISEGVVSRDPFSLVAT